MPDLFHNLRSLIGPGGSPHVLLFFDENNFSIKVWILKEVFPNPLLSSPVA